MECKLRACIAFAIRVAKRSGNDRVAHHLWQALYASRNECNQPVKISLHQALRAESSYGDGGVAQPPVINKGDECRALKRHGPRAASEDSSRKATDSAVALGCCGSGGHNSQGDDQTCQPPQETPASIQQMPCQPGVACSQSSTDRGIWHELGDPAALLQSSLSEAKTTEEALYGLRKLRQRYGTLLKTTLESIHRTWLVRLYLEMGVTVQDLEQGMCVADAVREIDNRRAEHEVARRF